MMIDLDNDAYDEDRWCWQMMMIMMMVIEDDGICWWIMMMMDCQDNDGW